MSASDLNSAIRSLAVYTRNRIAETDLVPQFSNSPSCKQVASEYTRVRLGGNIPNGV